MNRPYGAKWKAIQKLVVANKDNHEFNEFLEWIRCELNRRDIENRNVGNENKTSEAQALAVMLEVLTQEPPQSEMP